MKQHRLFSIITIAALLITAVSFTALAHSGRTDSAGGHHDYKNASGLGSYHYHHGYPAHLHPGGVCPYATPAATPSGSGASTTPSAPAAPSQPAAPAVPTKTLTASYPGISIYLDNSLIIPRDANGNIVAPFIVSGTTYLPVRAIATALDMSVAWDSATATISLNRNAADKELAFFRNNAGIITEDDDTYHHFSCPNWQGKDYQIHNTMYLESLDYTPCPDCWDDGLL